MSGRSIKRAPFTGTVRRPDRRAAGRTPSPRTPLAIRTSRLAVDDDLRDYIQRRIGWRLGKFAPHIERLTVRFEDVNGPRGGVDARCTIKVVISRLPSVVVTELAGDPAEAFDRADGRVERAVRRAIGRARDQGRLGRVPAPRGAPGEPSARRAGGGVEAPAAAPRNRNQRPRKAVAALEASARPTPSRKSTRGSANRAKQGNKLARRERRRVASPAARAGSGRRKRQD